jgi:hypothetical protein
VSVDGRPVKTRKLAHVQPSEMIRLTLKPSDVPMPESGKANIMEVSIR